MLGGRGNGTICRFENKMKKNRADSNSCICNPKVSFYHIVEYIIIKSAPPNVMHEYDASEAIANYVIRNYDLPLTKKKIMTFQKKNNAIATKLLMRNCLYFRCNKKLST